MVKRILAIIAIFVCTCVGVDDSGNFDFFADGEVRDRSCPVE